MISLTPCPAPAPTPPASPGASALLDPFVLPVGHRDMLCRISVIDVAPKRHTRMARWLRLERRLIFVARALSLGMNPGDDLPTSQLSRTD
jgi:hypothetical protein